MESVTERVESISPILSLSSCPTQALQEFSKASDRAELENGLREVAKHDRDSVEEMIVAAR